MRGDVAMTSSSLCQLVVWTIIALVAYVYVGYPTLLYLAARLRRETPSGATHHITPTVSLVIAARNEEAVLRQKLQNTLALSYPKTKLEVTVVSDGSTDATTSIARGFGHAGVHLLQMPENRGKASAQNRAVQVARGDILIFTDAEVCLAHDAIRQVVRHFHSQTVGCVVGRVRYVNGGETSVSQGEDAYWRYELFLRGTESDFGILAMGSGALTSIRRSLFEPLDAAVSEDFVLPMTLAMKGYKTVYEPAAIAMVPLFQVQPRDMFNTKARTITLDARGLWLCRGILNPIRYPLYSWGLISHKLLRWLVPYFLIALFVANLLLLDQPFYRFTLAAQWVCYGLAGLGYLWQRGGRKPPRFLGIPFSFCLVNAAAAVGVARFLMGKKSGTWTPVRETAAQ
jgi:hypothetical protein